MSHVMLDLETVSTQPNARIIAIGAVKFAPDKGVYDKFYQAVKVFPLEPWIYSHIDGMGFHVDHQTIKWWTQQSPEARAVFTDPNAVDIDYVLDVFSTWLLLEDAVETVHLWGNGASFDNVILAQAYRLRNIDMPWKFWNDRCYRTVKNLYPNVHMERRGTHHNALDDAETQAEHLLKMGASLG